MAGSDKKIAEMSQQTKNSTVEAKAEHEENMRKLQSKKKEALEHLDKMGKATSSAWDATKEGFAKAARKLHAAYEKAATSAKK